MANSSGKNKCFWPVLLALTVVACMSLLYGYWEIGEKLMEKTDHRKGIFHQEKLTEEMCLPVCDSKECVSFGKYLLSIMKPEADPCENIHTFVCGTYEEQFPIEESRNQHFDTETNMFKILDAIFRNIQADPESASGKLKIMYESCLNDVSLEKHALPTARNFLSSIGIPDWPNLAPDFEFKDNDIATVLGNMKAAGELLPLMFVVPSAEFSYAYLPRNETESMSVRLDARYFDSLLKLPTKESVIHILKYFVLDLNTIEEIWCDFQTVRNSILELKEKNCRNLDRLDYYCNEEVTKDEKNSCAISMKACPTPYEYYNTWFLDFHDSECPQSLLNCSDPGHDPTHMCRFVDVFLINSDFRDRINKGFVIIDEGDELFVARMIPTLKKFSDRTLANFLALNFYLSHLGELNFYFRLAEKRYFPHKRCKNMLPPVVLNRWRVCSKWFTKHMMFAVQYEFQKQYLTYEETRKIMDYFEEDKSEIAEVIDHQKRLSEEHKKILNIQGLKLNVQHLLEYQSRPQEYERSINEYHKAFHPKPDNFFHNVLELQRTSSDIHFLLSPINKYLLSLQFEKGAQYTCNDVDFYLGQLIPMHYLPGLPRIFNQLLFTVFAGHEIGHHIHLSLYHNNQFFNERSDERIRCLVDQFSQYRYEFADENLDGNQYLWENIGDNVFALLIDRLIEKYVSAHEEIILPGLAYSFRETAYIVINQMWCSKNADSEEIFYRKGEVHAPLKLRAIGPMQNSRAFSEAFLCQNGSYMNPSTKCAFLEEA